MSSEPLNLDNVLSDLGAELQSAYGTNSDGTETAARIPYVEPGYEGKIDYRIRQLSYSSLLTLHQCPRKFQLYKLRSTKRTEEDESSTITFSFGHVIGEGIQRIFQGQTQEEIWPVLLTFWKPELFAKEEKQNKDFWLALQALEKFYALRAQGFLEEYELVYYNGRPAVELSFAINFPDGFRLRGFVDAVLKHKETGEVIVLECKTTSVKLNPSIYKNSAQAIGYSVVLDVIFPELNSYKVLYLVYQTKDQEFTPIPFPKNYLQRALWIRELLLDIDVIKLYEQEQVYPMHGESCVAFGKECEYFQFCTLSTEYLTNVCTEEEVDRTEYQINVTLQDLLEAQFDKTEINDE